MSRERGAAVRRDVHNPYQPLSATVLDQLPLRPAMRIAEIRCGSGDLTLPLAARASPRHR